MIIATSCGQRGHDLNVRARANFFSQPSAAQQKNWAKAKKDTLCVALVETGEVGAVNSTVVTTPMIWSQDLQIIDMAPEGVHVDSGAVLVQLDRVTLSTQLQGKQTELDGHRSDMQRLQTEQGARIREMERDVEMGRSVLNFSEWHVPYDLSSEAGPDVVRRDMSPSKYRLLHGHARLTDREAEELARGLHATLGLDHQIVSR